MKNVIISVIGGHSANADAEKKAYDVGRIIAKYKAILVCGGLAGCMEAAAKGVKKIGGLTIGILPGKDKEDANPYIDIALPTTIGFARNTIVACSADLIIALPGSHGTLSEICYGLVYKKPIVDFGDWNIEGTIKAVSIEDVENYIKEFIKNREKNKT